MSNTRPLSHSRYSLYRRVILLMNTSGVWWSLLLGVRRLWRQNMMP